MRNLIEFFTQFPWDGEFSGALDCWPSIIFTGVTRQNFSCGEYER